MSGKSNFTVVVQSPASKSQRSLVELEEKTSLRRRTPPTPKHQVVLKIGDKLPIQVPYKGLHPNEPITVYYAIKLLGQESQPIPIFTKDFICLPPARDHFLPTTTVSLLGIFSCRGRHNGVFKFTCHT